MDPVETITITLDEYHELVAAQELLSALEAGGVDNWEWYYESTKHLNGDDEDDSA